MSFSIIAAVARDGAIGVTRDGIPGLPWPRLAADMRWFQAITMAANPIAMANRLIDEPLLEREAWHTEGNAIIMGKRTWESLGCKPLAHRHNIVVSTTSVFQWKPHDTMFTSKLDYALDLAKRLDAPHTFVIGGASLYTEALGHPDCERLFITIVDEEYPEADTYFPGFCLKDGYFLTIGAPRDPQKWKIRNESAWITEKERPPYKFLIMEKE